MQEKNVFVNDLKINYKIGGSGPAILILHGWGGSSNSWEKIIEILENKFKIVCLDFPGFGKSQDLFEPWGLKEYSDFILDFSKKINFKGFFLLGHSFGGRVAIKFARKYPEKLKGLILVSAAGIEKKNFKKFLISKLASFFKKFSFLPGYEFLKEIFYKFILKKTDYLKANGIMRETFKKIISEDLTPQLSRIKVSTLIVWGERDKITPLTDAHLMKEKIKNSRLEILKEVGHSPHLENPEILASKIINFLEQKSNLFSNS